MKLERQKIIDEALALLNDVGIDQLTTRRLAERLGVQQPALYWHFRNKNALLDAMNEEMLVRGHTRRRPLPDETWPDFLRENARSFRHALLAYRDGARVHAGNEPSAQTLADSEAQYHYLREAGFPDRLTFHTLVAVGNYVVGSVLEQQAAIDRPIPDPPPPEKQAAAPALFALVDRMMEGGVEANFNDTFEAGLNLIIEGLELRLAQTKTAP
jgi:TetR/AcrR family tetracycline transcriptional repressor